MGKFFRKKNHGLFLNYDKEHYLKLLITETTEECLSQKDYKQLNQYWLILCAEMDWETRNQYFYLLEKFIYNEGNGFQFCIDFNLRNKLNVNACEYLETNFIVLSAYEDCLNFSNFIFEILDFCSYFEKYNVSETIFRNSIENIYLKMKDLTKEE